MIAADESTLFRELGCEWNRNSDDIAQGDVLAAQFDACFAPHGIRAWNGPPNKEKARIVFKCPTLQFQVKFRSRVISLNIEELKTTNR